MNQPAQKTDSNPGKPTFTLTLEAASGWSDVPAIIRLRRFLKAALRSYGLRCTEAREITPALPDVPQAATSGMTILAAATVPLHDAQRGQRELADARRSLDSVDPIMDARAYIVPRGPEQSTKEA